MGAALIRSAHSPNIKERRDCSTALFDPAGELVMQAEHIPVHLGSMPDAVAAVVDREPAEGDLWILNDPFEGGTHLPDITLIAPLFADGRLMAWAASRAHHADVGGPTPGGMPADSPRARGGGRRDRAAADRRRGAGRAGLRGCATPPSASPTCAPSAPPTLLGARRFARAGRAPRRRPGRGVDERDARLRRAPHARARSPGSPTAPTRPPTSSRRPTARRSSCGSR